MSVDAIPWLHRCPRWAYFIRILTRMRVAGATVGYLAGDCLVACAACENLSKAARLNLLRRPLVPWRVKTRFLPGGQTIVYHPPTLHTPEVRSVPPPGATPSSPPQYQWPQSAGPTQTTPIASPPATSGGLKGFMTRLRQAKGSARKEETKGSPATPSIALQQCGRYVFSASSTTGRPAVATAPATPPISDASSPGQNQRLPQPSSSPPTCGSTTGGRGSCRSISASGKVLGT
jgi:hypothetical protein